VRALMSLILSPILGAYIVHETVVHRIWAAWFPDAPYVERVVPLDKSNSVNISKVTTYPVCCSWLTDTTVRFQFPPSQGQQLSAGETTGASTNAPVPSTAETKPEQIDLSEKDVASIFETLDAESKNFATETSISVAIGSPKRFEVERDRSDGNRPLLNKLLINGHEIDLSQVQVERLLGHEREENDRPKAASSIN